MHCLRLVVPIFLIAVTFGNASSAVAQTASLSVSRSPESWKGYPENVGKITYRWIGNVLHVYSVANSVSSLTIDQSSARVHIQGDHMQLCYDVKLNKSEENKLYPLSDLEPVMLEFTVLDIAKRKYVLEIADKCAR